MLRGDSSIAYSSSTYYKHFSEAVSAMRADAQTHAGHRKWYCPMAGRAFWSDYDYCCVIGRNARYFVVKGSGGIGTGPVLVEPSDTGSAAARNSSQRVSVGKINPPCT